MLHVGDASVPVCSGVSRRSFLQIGAAGMAGLSLPAMARLAEAGAVDESRQKFRNCITLFLVGSPGHSDTWDLKPEAPADVRGKFKPIPTNVPGIDICEHFPLMARHADKFSLIRSLYHTGAGTHEGGQYFMMTGHQFPGSDQHPWSGSVVARVLPPSPAQLDAVILPGPIGNTGTSDSHGQTPAYLGSGYRPFFLDGDPARPDFKVANLAPPPDQTEFRLSSRRRLLEQLDALERRVETQSLVAHDNAYQKAFSLITSPEAKRAFDLSEETPALRDRYGRNTFGQSCLLARRLIERGVRYVTINHFDTVFGVICWDMHSDGGNINITYDDFERHLCPQFDQAYSTLLEDLEERGLLSETVVATLSEMGRTPRLNPRGGRDHHTGVWTNFLAGGPVRGGQVIGSSDKYGEKPLEDPVHPSQVVASIYHAMGIDLDSVMMTGPGGRPIRLIEAEPIRGLF
ncbi:MAG: DUF1501 domain-containing protein [Pirellulales bacterium]